MLTRSRTVILAVIPLALALAPTGAQAAPVASDDGAAEMAALARNLQDPAMQDRLAGGLSNMLAAIMKMPVGQFAKAAQQIDPKARTARIAENATLGDLAGQGDPRFAQKMDVQTRQSVKAMGAMAGGLAAIMPALQAAMADFARSMDGVALPQD
jgi:hypothetical protein